LLNVTAAARAQSPARNSAWRTARATCRLDCWSARGSDPSGALIVMLIRTSRDAAAPVSIRPLDVGTNSSGPFSPTR